SDRLGGNAEMLEKIRSLGRCAEGLHADELAFRAQPALPAEAAGRLASDANRAVAAHDFLPVAIALLDEKLPRRHRHNGGVEAVFSQKFARPKRKLHFR